MKPSTFFYNVGQGFKGVFRNSVMSTASVLVLIACMILVGTFYLVIDTIDLNFQAIDNLNVIEVMINKSAGEDEIIAIGEKLADICDKSPIIDWKKSDLKDGETVPKHENFKFISSDEHLEKMKEMYDNPEWIDSILDHDAGHDEGTHAGITSSIKDNPLRASYRITFINLSDFDEVVKVRSEIDAITLKDDEGNTIYSIETEDIKDHADLYNNVMSIKNALYIAGVWLMAIFLLISLFVIMNTIKLGVFARRNEITFMRLCGATKSFIRMPFIVEGIIIGVFSAAVAFGLEYYLYSHVLTAIISSATGSGGTDFIFAEFSTYSPVIAIAFLAVGLFAGIISSSISLKKYLSA